MKRVKTDRNTRGKLFDFLGKQMSDELWGKTRIGILAKISDFAWLTQNQSEENLQNEKS